MKIKKYACILAAALMLALLSACGQKSMAIPFSSLTLSTTKEEVIAAYGESSNIDTATDGGETLCYESEYHGKTGRLGFHFTQDEEIKTIYWFYSADDKAEFDTLVTAIKEDMAKDFGDPMVTNDNGNIWKKGKTVATLFTVSIDGLGGIYNVNLIYSKGGDGDLDTSAPEEAPPAAVTEYKLGDTAQGQRYALTVDSVDATPEYGDYVASDADKMFFFVSLELTNNSDAAVEAGDILKLFADDEECRWTTLFEDYNGVDQLDTYSSVEAGRKIKGYVAASVPNKWNKVQLVCDDIAFTFTHADLGSISSQNETGEAPTYTVGETLTRNGMKITLTGAMQTDYVPESTYLYYEPDAGNNFVVMFFDLRNDSRQSQKFNASAVFDPYVDDYSTKFTRFLGTEIEGVEALTDNDYTDILPGKSLEGYMVMEVPSGWKKIELTTRQGNFELTSDQVTVQ